MAKKLYVEKDRVQSVVSGRFAFWHILAIAAGAGVLYFLLALAIDNFIISPISCSVQNFNSTVCGNSEVISGNISLIIAACITTLSLARIAVYRSMLITIATTVMLWGTGVWFKDVSWVVVLLWSIALFALILTSLAYIVRRFRFIPSLILVIIIVVLARLAIIWS